MPKSWYQRLWLVLAVVLGSLYVLLPTFLWRPAGEGTTVGVEEAAPAGTPRADETAIRSPTDPAEMAAAGTTTGRAIAGADGDAAAEAAEEMPGYMAFFPKKRLRLGLDLVGGSHLALGVDTDEALRTLIGGHRREVKDRLTKEGIPFESVSQPLGTTELEVALKAAEDRDDLRDLMEKHVDSRLEEKRFGEKDGAFVAAYGFESAWIDELENQSVTQVLELLRTRVNEFGVAEPIIFREKTDRIVVELPGLKNPEEAIQNIKRTALLEFHIVDEDWYRDQGGDGAGTALLRQWVDEALAGLGAQATDAQINQTLVGKVPEDSGVWFMKTLDPKTKQLARTQPMLLKREIALTGDRLQDANPNTDRFNKWQVQIRFDEEGGDKFAKVTGENVGKRMAVVLEGAIQTAPQIQDKIEGGDAVITLGSGRDPQAQANEAANIARVLKTGALPAPVRIEQNRTVGPSLGADSIEKGVRAGLLGTLLVFAFAIYWYRASGVIAVTTLIANAIVLLGAMTFFDATLTLPGIAGVVLTIGMAVDSNVLIYERIREELRIGKTIKAAVDAGFDKAFTSIVDGNLTTAAAGVVLYLYGTDQIKGFAVTLLIGIATTLFTALVITRLLFDYWTIKLKPQTLSI